MKRLRIAVALFALLIAGNLVARQRRIALVYGNGDYGPDNQLEAARVDAGSIHDKLEELEFDKVIVRIDADKEGMKQALDQFKEELATADEALVYYSGHGAQIEQNNYLLPAGVDHVTKENIRDVTFPVEEIYQALREGNSRFNLVILDACRNNPLLEMIDPHQRCAGWDCGLAEPRRAPAGTIIAFSTSPDELADDVGGDGHHSPYTFALLNEMGEPGLPIQDLFVRVHRAMEEVSQVPWENTSQKLPFMFRDPVYAQVTIDQADDEVTVTLNGQTVSSSLDGSRTRDVRLAAGTNILLLTNFNQKTRRGGGMLSSQEGWKYKVIVGAKSVQTKTLESFEDCPDPTIDQIRQLLQHPQPDQRGNLPLPWDCLPDARFGHSFFGAAMRINLDRESGRVSFPVFEPEVWRDGFSLADNRVRDELDLSVAWAVTRHDGIRDVRLYDDGLPGALRPIAELRQSLAAAHEHTPRAADESHKRAVDLIRNASDEKLIAAINSARHWQVGILQDLRWTAENSPAFAGERSRTPRDFAALREAYRTAQNHNPEAMNVLDLFSNGELDALLNAIP